MPRRPKPTPEGIVAELLTLLQEISADGIITDDEAKELHEWLLHNRNEGIPKFEFLRGLLDQFLADGKITEPERKAIHAAIEKVLPPELRQEAKLARQARQLREKVEAANQRDAEKAKRPVYIGDFMVAGVRYEGRESLIRQFLREGYILHLVRESTNSFDENAVLIRTTSGHDIGYVPREDAALLAPLLDAGGVYSARCKKILDGRHYPIPVVYAQVFRGNQAIPNTFRQSEAPAKSDRTKLAVGASGSGTGCGGCATIVISICSAIALLIFLAVSK